MTTTITRLATVRTFLGDGPFERRITILGRPVRIQNRGPEAVMGRFGGGWERELGIQLGRRGLTGTIIVNLWRGSIRIDPRPTK
jgi:hypothetical protein